MTDPAVNERPKTPIIIHVGYPKTGTTWLQKRVFPVLPDIDFWPDTSFLEAMVPNENNPGRITTVAFPWDNVGSRPVMISWEALLGNFRSGSV